VIPLPEPARRGLINLTDDVIATADQSVAAAAQLDLAVSLDRSDPVLKLVAGVRSNGGRLRTRLVRRRKDHVDELH
jgi:hypothetical protein